MTPVKPSTQSAFPIRASEIRAGRAQLSSNSASTDIETDDTFVFMDDTHADASVGSRDGEIASVLTAIQKLNGLNWPEGTASAGQQINLQAVFVNGDLCEHGGGWRGFTNKVQGPNLIQFMNHFPSGISNDVSVYLGIGNHDLEWDQTGVDFDYFRDQMWGFHRQWTDVSVNSKNCIQTVSEFDADNTPDWKGHSQNWLVNTGGVIYIQMHRFGGDTRFGHADGFEALQQWLRNYPYHAIVLLQHYGWDQFSTGDDAAIQWTTAQQETLIKMFAGRKIIGAFHGHTHTPPPYHYKANCANMTFDCFAPGAVMVQPSNSSTGRRFGLARITTQYLDVVFCQVDSSGFPVPQQGQTFTTKWNN